MKVTSAEYLAYEMQRMRAAGQLVDFGEAPG
jgi:hypothetical protein